MSTLRINNIEAQSIPASPTIDEKVKVTNSSGDILVNIDGKTSGITTIGINTTDGNIKFDANSNVLITGILTATTLSGNFTPTSLEIGSNIKLGNAGVITATSFVGALTGTASNASGATGDFSIADKIVHTGDTNTAIRFPSADTFSVETAGNTRLHIHSDGRFRVGTTSQPSGTVGGFQLDMGSYPGSMRLMSGAGASGTESAGFSIGGSNHNANIENGANSGAQVNLYNYNTSDGNSSAVSFLNSNGLSVARVLGLNVSHSSRTGALVFMTSSGSHPTEKLRIDSSGRTLINTTAVTNTNDTLTVKRAASGFTEMSMTVDANTATGTHANAFVFTKSKNTYWNGLGFQSSHGHIGAIVGMRDAAGGDADQKIRIEIGGTGINASEEKTWDFKNNGDLSISDGNLIVASGHGISFAATYDGSNVANVTATSELLDDYEEGTFQPILKRLMANNSTETSFYNQGTRAGNYTRIGDRVWITGAIYWNGGSTGSGSVILTNLPFTVNSGTANDGVPLVVGFRSGWNYRDMTGYSAGNMNRFYLAYYDSSGTYNISPGATASQGTLYFSANYELV